MVRPDITRFATSFFTLGYYSVIICLKGALPLIEVLRLVDSDQKPAMGFIYEAMDQTKEKIQKAFNGVKKRYFMYLFVEIVILKFKIKKLTQCNIFCFAICLCGTSLMKGGTNNSMGLCMLQAIFLTLKCIIVLDLKHIWR